MIAAAVLLVATLALRSNKLGPTAPGDALVRAQLSNPGAAHPLLIRGRVVAEPQRRSRATVRLLVKLEAIQTVAGEQWLPAQEVVGVDVCTRGRNGRKGDISADLPALVQSDAYGDRIEAAVLHPPAVVTKTQEVQA